MSTEKRATPHADLIDDFLDSRTPKSEREHSAVREIQRLRKSVEDWRAACVRAERNAAMSQELDAPHTCKNACERRAYQLEIRRLQFENVSLRKDAERYRWLRDKWLAKTHKESMKLSTSQ